MMGARRNFVIMVSFLAPLLGAAEPQNWDTTYNRGLAALEAGRYAEALPALVLALEQARAFPAQDIRTVRSTYTLALVYHALAQFEQAEPLYFQAKSIVEAMGAPGRSLLGYVLDALGEMRFDQGRWKDAEPLLRQAVASCRETHGEASLCTLTAMRHLAQVLSVLEPTVEAEGLFQKLIDTVRQTPGLPRDFQAACLSGLATLYVRAGQYEPAEPLLKESLELTSQPGGPPAVLADSLVDLAELYRLEHNAARAEPLLKKALRIYEVTNDPHQAGALNELGLIALEQGKYAIAKERLRQSLSIYQHLVGPAHVLVARVKAGLAQAFLGERSYAEAKSLIQEAMETERKALGDDHAVFARLLMIAGKIEEQAHRGVQAAQYYRQAVEVYKRSVATGDPELTQAERQYARFAKSLRK